jgi:ATP-dependent RNA helicase DHX57
MGKQTHEVKSDDQVVTQLTLPIDKFESAILRSIQTQRVTIIHGDTGCGKSSRVPTMILRAPVPQCDLSEVKIYISQPRRIAAKSLVERVRKTEVDISHKVALRMGHDEQEYESTETRAWFVTSFYLLWLLANDTKHFDDVTHIIIDEAHERSVHAEILCLSCRRLLQSNPHIRLVLMSATLDVDMYAKYFGVSQPPIQISGCPFNIKAFFVEDLPKAFRLSYHDQILVGEVINECNSMKCRSTPQHKYMEKLYRLAVRTVECVGKPGTSILIFVAGMADIMSIIDLVENLNARALQIRYTCFPIHSDIAFSEKMAALETPALDEIKIIIGTNAAESSITFPDVDHVICLGLQKQILYDEASHAQLLCPTWISRANAIQRAGRTGRTGNGNVYRLYSRKSFEEYMLCNEIGEMSRVPLDSVILAVKATVNEPAIEVLTQCLEPPNLKTVQNAFVRLYNQKFLSSPNDGGSITNLGSMVASLGVDLKLGTLIGLGIQFGVAPEAIELATILSFSKSPWISCNFWAQEPRCFNGKSMEKIESWHMDFLIVSFPVRNHKKDICFQMSF